MLMSSWSVFLTRMIPDTGIAALTAAGFSVEMNPFGRPLRHEELVETVGRHDGVMTQLSDAVDRAVLKAAEPRCQVVANCAAGYDNIDLAAARKYGITITHTPDVLTETTADLTWALMMSTARRVGEAERFLRAGAWRGWGMLDFLGSDVHGKTLGIVGAGRIGTAVARRAAGFDMRVLYADRGPKGEIEALGAVRSPLNDLLRESDFVSVHVPLTEETRHMIDEKALRRMKGGAFLINTSRGPIVDEAALTEALRENRLAGAGLDVFEKEPAVPRALLEMEQVVLLPHVGSATVATRSRMADMAAANVVSVLRGAGPLNPVIA